MAVKLTAAEVSSRLAPVKNREGAAVEAQSDFIVPVDFFVESRGATYQALVQTNLYSLRQVLDFQTATGKLQAKSNRNKARKAADGVQDDLSALLSADSEGSQSHRIRGLITQVAALQKLLPEYEADASELPLFEMMVGFLEIGLICWNVPDIEATAEGMLEGEFAVVNAAIEELQKIVLPSSQGPTTEGQPNDEASSLTTTPSAETSAASTNDTSAASSQTLGTADQTKH